MKEKVMNMLEQLAHQAQSQKEIFKYKAYVRARQTLQEHKEPIYDVSHFKDLPGIGVSIMKKIQEWVDTGKLEALEKNKAQQSDIADLIDIHGIGPVKALALYKQDVTKDNIKDHLHLLNDAQQKGVKYKDDFALRIPRQEMKKHEALLRQALEALDIPNSVLEVVGSYRRREKTSGDIDVLLTLDASQKADMICMFRRFIDRLRCMQYVVDHLAHGNKKFMGVCQVSKKKPMRRLDILWTEPSVFPFSLLYFTGPQSFNIRMRERAHEKGYKLSEYGLEPIDQTHPDPPMIKEEKDIFAFLDMEYSSPHTRK